MYALPESRSLLSLAALALACSLPLAARAELLTNGGFESEPNFGGGVAHDAGYTALTGSQIPGWTIAAGHAVTIHNTVLYPTISGSYSVNMDGEGYGGGNAILYQDFASASSTSYTLQYDWSTWYYDTTPKLNVTVTDTVTSAVLYTGTFAALNSNAVQHVSTSFAGTGNTLRLLVQEAPQSGYNDNAFMVDNFSVNAVPEAPTVALWLAGLAVLGGLRARRWSRQG